MKRSWLAPALGLLAGTASCGDEQREAASGQRALGATSADSGVGNVALAGDVVLLVQEGEYTLRVRRVPLDGTQSTIALTVRLSPDKIPSGQLAGSDALAGLVLHTETPTSTLGHSQVFRGPPLGRLVALGPLKPLRPKGYFAAAVHADEKRLLVTESRGDLRAARHVVYEIGRRPRPIDLPANVLQTEFAGDLVAYVVPAAKPRRLVVRNWRTGARQAVIRVPSDIETFDLGGDGRVVVAGDNGNISEIRRGRARRQIARSGTHPAYAGERIAYLQRARRGPARDRVAIVEVDGTTRVLGASSGPTIDELVANDRHIVWVSGGCAFAAAVSGAARPGSRGCSRE